MNLSQETTKELILTLLGIKNTDKPGADVFTVGKNYHIRTVTMALAGELKSIDDKFIVLSNASWVADTGRYNEYIKDTSKVKENEYLGKDMIISIGAIVDAVEVNDYYKSVK